MATESLVELRDWLFLILLCLTLLVEVLEFAAATAAVAEAVASEAEYQGEVPCPSTCRCDDSFVYCNDRGLSIIPALPLAAAVLYLQNNRIDNAGLPTSLERRMTVRVIYLYDNELDDFPRHLPPSLRELHLQDNNIRTLPRAALARLPLLEKLHLDDNSVSTVSIEDKAFANNPRLRLLFLSRNHLSSIPSGLPASLEELRLDDNRISTIPTHAFRGLSSLRRLFLDGNLLANQRIADDTFARLANLTELSLVRNSLLSPPLNLPTSHLLRLYLQDNAMAHMPRGSLDGMKRLQKLDLSGNNLTTLPRGLFRDLDSLTQLLMRGNPWYCGCNLRWLYDWLHMRGASVTVRGLTCHAPERVRGQALKDLTGEMKLCEATGEGGLGGGGVGGGSVGGVSGRERTGAGAALPTLPAPTTTRMAQGSLFTLRSKHPGHIPPDLAQDHLSESGHSEAGRPLQLSVKPITQDTIHVMWTSATPAPSFRLSWLRLGTSPAMGDITETLVPGDRREYLLTHLQPQSSYIVCIVPLYMNEGKSSSSSYSSTNLNKDHEHPACAKTETLELTRQSGSEQDGTDQSGSDQFSALPMAGIIGGATALVSLLLIFGIFCWYGHRVGYLAPGEQQTMYGGGGGRGPGDMPNGRGHGANGGGKHYDDYAESGTIKDTSILEIRGPGFQMTPMAAHQALQMQPKGGDMTYIHTIFPSNTTTSLYRGSHNHSNHHTDNSGYGTNRGYRERGIPDIDYSYT